MRYSLLIAIFLIGSSGFSAHGEEPEGWQGPFFFIQMADPQLGFSTDNGPLDVDVELFRRAVQHANRLQPAFVVVCGDLVHILGDNNQANAVLRVAAELDASIPLYWVSGNHDVGAAPDAASLKWYRTLFGPDRYTFHAGGCRFVVVNSTLIHNPSRSPEEELRQRRWIYGQLVHHSGPQPVHTIVLQHHPWFLEKADEPDAYFNTPLSQRQVYLPLLRKGGVRTIFAGHRHQNVLAEDQGIEMITTGPVGRPLGSDPSGFRIVEVYRDRIEHAYYGLDNVPERVILEER